MNLRLHSTGGVCPRLRGQQKQQQVGEALIALAFSANSIALAILVAVVMVLVLVFLGLISGAVNGIFQASLYQYATTGDAGKFIDTDLAREAFLTG